MSTCAFDTGFSNGFQICTPVVVDDEPFNPGWSEYIPKKTLVRIIPIRLAGEAWGDPYTEPAKIIVHPRVGAEASANAYTDGAYATVKTVEIAHAMIKAQLSAGAWDTGEFSANAVLVDDDIEALMLLGVI